MKTFLKKILLNNVPLKIISLIFGYSFWYLLGHAHVVSIWLQVPLSFYSVPQNLELHAPEHISVNISGKRTDLYSLDTKHIAAHVNAEHLHNGANYLFITEKTLFLPDSIKLVHYKPSNIFIDAKEKKEHTIHKKNAT